MPWISDKTIIILAAGDCTLFKTKTRNLLCVCVCSSDLYCVRLWIAVSNAALPTTAGLLNYSMFLICVPRKLWNEASHRLYWHILMLGWVKDEEKEKTVTSSPFAAIYAMRYDPPDSSRWCNIDVTFFFDIVLFSILISFWALVHIVCIIFVFSHFVCTSVSQNS